MITMMRTIRLKEGERDLMLIKKKQKGTHITSETAAVAMRRTSSMMGRFVGDDEPFAGGGHVGQAGVAVVGPPLGLVAPVVSTVFSV
jgi:hypothetical protein